MRFRILGMIMLCIASTACDRQAKRQPPTPTNAPLAQNLNAAVPGSVIDWTFWSYWDCSVGWNEYCQWDEKVAPRISGWDVCKPYYTVAAAGRGKPIHVGATGVPWRFARYTFSVSGSGEWWNRWGSRLRLENIGMKLIKAPATQAQRDAAGCKDLIL